MSTDDLLTVLSLFFGVPLVVLVLLAITFAGSMKSRRGKTLRAWAREHGFEYDNARDFVLLTGHDHFRVFSPEHRAEPRNTMAGRHAASTLDAELLAGDTSYEFVGEDDGRTERSYILATLPFAMPRTIIRPETSLDSARVDRALQHVNVEDAAFSREVFIGAENRRFAYDLVHPLMIEHLRTREEPGVIEIRGRDILFLDRTPRHWTPEEFTARLERVRAFLDLFPEHLARDLDERSKA